MPIRFRCVYCEKLLGIAHRKAGTVVNCPQCNEKLIVPTPMERGPVAEENAFDEEPNEAPVETAKRRPMEAAVKPSAKLFEQSDMDALLEGHTYRDNGNSPNIPPPPPPFSPPAPVLPPSMASTRTAPPMNLPVRFEDDSKMPGFYVSPGKATWLSVLGVILLALAFAAGLLVGKFIK